VSNNYTNSNTDHNLTLADTFNAFETNCGRDWDSNLETINMKPATLLDCLFVSYSANYV